MILLIYTPLLLRPAALGVRVYADVCNSCTIATRDFADIYTQTLRGTGLRGKGVYINKIATQLWYK